MESVCLTCRSLVFNLVPRPSFPWQAVGKRELWEHPFWNNKGNNRILHIRIHCAVRNLHLWYLLAYGGWARGTISSQNFGVPTKRYDNSLPFSSQLTKIKTVSQFLWPLLVVIEYSGFNLTRNSVFCSKEHNYYSTLRYSTNYERGCHAEHFWRQNRSLETQNGSYFSVFAN